MSRSLTLAFVAVLVGLAPSCKEEEDKPPPASNSTVLPGGGSGGAETDGGPGSLDGAAADAAADADAGACNDLLLLGGFIDQIRVLEDAPAGQGGPYVGGTYDLTDARVYVGALGVGGPSGTSYQSTIQIAPAGTSLARVVKTQPTAGGPSQEARFAGTYIESATSITYAADCPAAINEQYSFTAANNQITLVNLLTKESFTYTLR